MISVWICEYREEEEEEEKKADNFFYSTQFIMHNSTNIKTLHSHKQAFWVNKKVSGTNTIKERWRRTSRERARVGVAAILLWNFPHCSQLENSQEFFTLTEFSFFLEEKPHVTSVVDCWKSCWLWKWQCWFSVNILVILESFKGSYQLMLGVNKDIIVL